ncbi:MAG TPA: hypothetical protein VD887_06390 [Allosphingosinicella sp.]|nr:hypothetical protein [Allosphingosinicella sp.]
MRPPPRPAALTDAAWSDWIDRAPILHIDKRGDAFFARARRWLDAAPATAPQAAPDAREVQSWIMRFQQRLDSALSTPDDVNTDDLKKSSISLVASGAVPLAIYKLGASAAVALGTGFGLAVVGVGFAAAGVKRATVKWRKGNMMSEIRLRLADISDRL